MPISIGSQTSGCVNAWASMLVKPNISPPKPKMERLTEKKSAFVLRSVAPKLCSPKKASSTEATPMTVSVMKIERHPFASVCHPPITGPMAGATLIAMPTVPMANPRRESG